MPKRFPALLSPPSINKGLTLVDTGLKLIVQLGFVWTCLKEVHREQRTLGRCHSF
jgi:hypothetical protein